eukprot:748291-Rhodomonas_salina.1
MRLSVCGTAPWTARRVGDGSNGVCACVQEEREKELGRLRDAMGRMDDKESKAKKELEALRKETDDLK